MSSPNLELQVDRHEQFIAAAKQDLYDGNPATQRPGLVRDYWETKAEHRGRSKLLYWIILLIGALAGLDKLIAVLQHLHLV